MIPWRFSLHGWEFSLRDCDCEPSCTRWWDELWLEQRRFKVPLYMCDVSFCITHLGSGLQFRFQACDALRRWIWEKLHCEDEDGFALPTYDSPLLPVGFDSAYVGRVLFAEKPSGTPWNINHKWEWEDIDWETLHKRIVWANKHDKIFGKPYSGSPGKPKSKVQKRAKEKAETIAKREESEGRRKNYELKDLQDTLINMELLLFVEDDFLEEGSTSCYLNLVVTESGWFFSQRQLFSSNGGAKRIREMTMHCSFEEDIIYREIIERQSKNFQERVCQASKRLWGNQLLEADDGMHLHFHEVKQLVVKGVFQRVLLGSSMVHDAARRYSSFVGDEKMDCKDFATSDVFDDQIELLLSNSGEQIEWITKGTCTCVQIIPLFRHPHDPTIRVVLRKAYMYGLSKHDIDYAKLYIAHVLGGTTQLCSMESETKTQRKAIEKAKGDTSVEFIDVILSDVATIFGQE